MGIYELSVPELIVLELIVLEPLRFEMFAPVANSSTRS